MTSSEDLSQPHSTLLRDPELLSLAAIWRGKWWILLSVLISLGIGSAYLQQTVPLYEAKARVLVRQEGLSLDREPLARKDREFIATQAEIIRSPLTIEDALKSTSITRPPTARPSQDDVSLVLSALRVTPIAKTDVLTIAYRSRFSEEISPLIDKVIESYQHHVRTAETTEHSDVLELITRREVGLRDEIAVLEDELLKLRAGGPLLGQGRDTVNIHASLLADLSKQLTDTKGRRLEIENRLRMLAASGQMDLLENNRLFSLLLTSGRKPLSGRNDRHGEQGESQPDGDINLLAQELMLARNDDLGPSTGDGGQLMPALTKLVRSEENTRTTDVDEIQQELWRAKAKLLEVSKEFGPLHAQTKAATEQVKLWEELMRKRLVDRMQAVTAGLAEDRHAIMATEDSLQEMYEAERVKAKELDNYVLRETLLVNNIRRLESLHEVILETLTNVKFEEGILSQGRASVTVQVLESADRTLKQVWPLPAALLAACGIVGITGGLLLTSFTQSLSRMRAACSE